MTKQCYASMGCAAGSQERGLQPDSGCAWGVNFNNGNSNDLNHDNDHFVRAVRASESPHAVPFHHLHRAWRAARRKKLPSANQLDFERQWPDGLLDIQQDLTSGTWSPRPTVCFIAKRPKAREIHAPDFRDRIVHHWLVPHLESIWEPKFIHDSFSNRVGKGTMAAVERCSQYLREVRDGEGGGWYLQLDIANFFNTIHRPTLWRILKSGLQRAAAPEIVQRVTHALLKRSPLASGVEDRSTPAEHARVPAHKRLTNAGPGLGLPIGNLSSQFFSNVYLDRLDQFVKHVLKAKRYLRYVDDFVLFHRDREQLAAWRDQIEAFLRDELCLELKADQRLKPISAGVDFLGYECFAGHRLIRRRVIGHAREKLTAWERRHVREGVATATPAEFRLASAIWQSYLGHFGHGSAHRLTNAFLRRYAWLTPVARRRFDYQLEGRPVSIRFKGVA